jgi:HD-GYP domain-containing protein (c-di-GMP phosphodiesterase class II)
LLYSVTNTTRLIDCITSQLAELDSLSLSNGLLEQVRLDRIRLMVRHIETSFPEHFGHGERTANCALLIGNAINLTKEQVIDLHYAALLHDLGLLTIPGSLNNNTAPLTLDEYVRVQSHPRAGASLLMPYSFLSEPARLIAHHHERWDGAGYPYGLRGAYIPVSSRILAIADAFDVIANRAGTYDAALRTLHASSGSQFDPSLLATFCRLMEDEDNRLPAQLFGKPLSAKETCRSLQSQTSTMDYR